MTPNRKRIDDKAYFDRVICFDGKKSTIEEVINMLQGKGCSMQCIDMLIRGALLSPNFKSGKAL